MSDGDKTTPPGSGSGAAPPGSPTVPCPAGQCPAMEIEINDTPVVNDDLVGLKCEHPPHRNIVNCRIRATSACPTASTVVLTNPDGRLRFPNPADTTTTVTVPSDGSWAAFQISGERGSNAIGDAVIEAHCNTATGALKAKKGLTVFWFDELKVEIATPGTYSVTGGRYTTTGGRAASYSVSAKIKPAGVDCAAPQVKDLRVGIVQNVRAGPRLTTEWDSPTIAWTAGVAAGTTVTVPAKMQELRNRPVLANDSEASVDPLYDQPGKTGTLDANSLKPPMGCAGGAVATSFDTPSNPTPPTFTAPAVTPAGTNVGTVTWRFLKTKIDNDFLTWVTIFNTVTNDLCILRERTWAVHADSSVAGLKATTGASDRAPTMDPLTTGRFSNDIVNDPANVTTGPAGAATTTFTK